MYRQLEKVGLDPKETKDFRQEQSKMHFIAVHTEPDQEGKVVVRRRRGHTSVRSSVVSPKTPHAPAALRSGHFA